MPYSVLYLSDYVCMLEQTLSVDVCMWISTSAIRTAPSANHIMYPVSSGIATEDTTKK